MRKLILVALLSTEIGYLIAAYLHGAHEELWSYFSPNMTSATAIRHQPVNSVTYSRLECITVEALDAVRVRPASIRLLRPRCEDELNQKLDGLGLSEQQKDAVLASLFAHALKPYGQSFSYKLKDLLKDSHLDCDNYTALTGYLLKYIRPTGYRLRFVGFDGGAVGNHAQLIFEDANGQLLIDPTIGLVARVEFNELMSGKPIPPYRVRVFYHHGDTPLAPFVGRVVNAIVQGQYRPSDLLFYVLDLEDYIAFLRETAKNWKKDQKRLVRSYPTPGAAALQLRLRREANAGATANSSP